MKIIPLHCVISLSIKAVFGFIAMIVKSITNNHIFGKKIFVFITLIIFLKL